MTPLPIVAPWSSPSAHAWVAAVAFVEAVRAPAAIFTTDRARGHANQAAAACGLGPMDFDQLLGPRSFHAEGAPDARCTGRALVGLAYGSVRHPGVCLPLRIEAVDLLLCVLTRCPQASSSSTPEDKLRRLPPRQARVASLVLHGLSDKEIAHRLALSHHTVRTYLRQVLQRMGVHSRAELVSRLCLPDAG